MEEETRIAGGEGRAVGGKQGRRQAENPENPSNIVLHFGKSTNI